MASWLASWLADRPSAYAFPEVAGGVFLSGLRQSSSSSTLPTGNMQTLAPCALHLAQGTLHHHHQTHELCAIMYALVFSPARRHHVDTKGSSASRLFIQRSRCFERSMVLLQTLPWVFFQPTQLSHTATAWPVSGFSHGAIVLIPA